MRIKEVLKKFEIYMTNEEREVFNKIKHIRPMEAYSERDRFVIENLIRKSLVSKVKHQNVYMVVKNDRQ